MDAEVTNKAEVIEQVAPVEKVDEVIKSDTEINREKFSKESLGGEKFISEAELRGEEVPEEKPEKKKAEAKTKEEEGQTEKGGLKSSEEKSVTSPPLDEKKSEEKKSEEKKPPEGYVPLEALHEERKSRKQLANELAQLRKEHEDFKSSILIADEVTDPDFKDFKILSDAEYEEMVEDNLADALKYERKLRMFQEKQRETEKKQALERNQKESFESAVREGITEMEKTVPGIYDEDSKINMELASFAVSNGLSNSIIDIVTDPRTMVIPPGETKPVILGKGAASIVGMIYKFFQGEQSKEKGNGNLEKDLREKLTKEITTEVMKKFKTDPEGYKSIGDVPGGSDDAPGGKKVVNEASFRKLSKEEQEKMLRGAM
jgi:hypothetical protein